MHGIRAIAESALHKDLNTGMDTELEADDNFLPETMAPNDKIEPQKERLLGAYLFALCVYQIGIYCWPGGPPFILDPRAGIAVLLINHFAFDNKVIYPVEWITVTWLVVAAAMIFFRGRFLKPYLIAEVVLAAPTAYYIAVLAIQHGGHFAPGFKDLVLTATLFTIFSMTPIGVVVQRLGARKK
jgi:hypothetical protein